MKQSKQTVVPQPKRYQDMTPAELRAATREFDAEVLELPKTRAPSAAREAHTRILARARAEYRGRGRPKVGEGAKRVLITLERGLLADADALAKRRKISRSELIALGLRLAMGKSKRSA